MNSDIENKQVDVTEDMHTIMLDDFDTSVYIGTSSVIGSRKYQQDSIKVDDFYSYLENGKAIAVLCDGMGGLSSGEKASATCTSVIYDAFHSVDTIESVADFYKSIVAFADHEVVNLKNDDGSHISGSGTTLTSVIIDGNDLYWVSVGDSHIYVIRGDKIICVTKEHNYLMILNQRLQRGEITQEDVDKDPQKEALVSYIGMGGIKYMDINLKPLQLLDGDYVVLCSDGLYRTVSDDEIRQIVQKNGTNTDIAADDLTKFALSKNKKNQDNTSVVVIGFKTKG